MTPVSRLLLLWCTQLQLEMWRRSGGFMAGGRDMGARDLKYYHNYHTSYYGHLFQTQMSQGTMTAGPHFTWQRLRGTGTVWNSSSTLAASLLSSVTGKLITITHKQFSFLSRERSSLWPNNWNIRWGFTPLVEAHRFQHTELVTRLLELIREKHAESAETCTKLLHKMAEKEKVRRASLIETNKLTADLTNGWIVSYQ